MAVSYGSTELYQLKYTDGSEKILVDESSDYDFSTDSTASGNIHADRATTCGKASERPGQSDGAAAYDDDPCQTYVFGMVADDLTLSDGTTNLTMQWFNPNSRQASQYSWLVQYGVSARLLNAANPVAVANRLKDQSTQVALRFPA